MCSSLRKVDIMLNNRIMDNLLMTLWQIRNQTQSIQCLVEKAFTTLARQQEGK